MSGVSGHAPITGAAVHVRRVRDGLGPIDWLRPRHVNYAPVSDRIVRCRKLTLWANRVTSYCEKERAISPLDRTVKWVTRGHRAGGFERN